MTEQEAARPERQGRRWVTSAAWVVAVVLWIVFSFGSGDVAGADTGVEKAGRVTGGLLFTLGVGLVLRFLYVKLRRSETRAFWSPWIFVIAAVVGFLATAGNAGGS
jgi:hypothetical protein